MKNLPETNITNEVRYAVVMYGGVSLCIYINGVAQEFDPLRKNPRFQKLVACPAQR